MTLVQSRLKVDATSWRCIDVEPTLYTRHVPTAILSINLLNLSWIKNVSICEGYRAFKIDGFIKKNTDTVEQWSHWSRNIRKHTFGHVHSAKIQISLRIRAVRSESSLSAFWIANNAKFFYSDNEGSSDCADAQADLSSLCKHIRRCFLTLRYISFLFLSV